MPIKDLHSEPFDEATLIKLGIFEDYAEAWLPVFIMSGHPTICIFDLFAGSGYDKIGVAGSPIRVLEKAKYFLDIIKKKNTKINIYFNEYNPKKFALLQDSCNAFLKENPDLSPVINIHYSQEDFEVCFNHLLPTIDKYPSLVYLDQNGVKFLADKYLLPLEKSERTDFLYFVSSSYIKRFGNSEEFKQYIDFDMKEVAEGGSNFIHRNLITQLVKKLPKGSKLKLYPFSLKKGANIYGIIFGAKNPLAVEKFLNIAWKNNPINGDANFDLDEDKKKKQLDIFEGKKMTKLESFKNEVIEKVKTTGTIINAELYQFALDKGHTPKQMADILKELKKQRMITFGSISPKITYSALNKKEDLIEIKWAKNGGSEK